MSEKIKQIIANYKNNQVSPEETRGELIRLLADNGHKAQALALIALLFGEVAKESFYEIDHNHDYFLAIIRGNVQNPSVEAKKENLLIYKNRIIATSSDLPDDLPEEVSNIYIIDANNCVITPGLIDQHTHGGYGCDFNYSSVDEMLNLAKNLPKHGITSIVPTIMTAPKKTIKDQTEKIKVTKENLPENSTKFIGIHLEGPFLCPKYKGIHPESEFQIPNVENYKKLEDQEIKIVSFAPELDEGFKLTKYLAEKGVIPSAGHTNASAELIREAANNGLRQITHLFNAMTPLHHREPGVTGEALTNDNLYVEVIADGLHLNPGIVDIILRTKPESKVIFISDSLPLNQAPNDTIIFGGQKIYRKDNKAVNENGTFAGSLIFPDDAIKNAVNWSISSFLRAIGFATLNVARNLGLEDLGYIKKDMIADIVIWNNNYQIKTTIINGQIAYKSV